MNDIQSSGMKFSPSVASTAKVRTTKHKDPRTWTDKMFQEFSPETGEVTAIDVDIIDCSGDSTLGAVNLGSDNIAILMDFALNVETTAMLKGEDVFVLGGNRAGRGGQGRLFVPASQFEMFLKHCAALYESSKAQLPSLRETVRASRNAPENPSEAAVDMVGDDFLA